MGSTDLQSLRLRHLPAALLLAALSVVMPVAHGSENAEVFPFGPQVYLFNPRMPLEQIQTTVDRIAAAQIDNQFGTDRYSILFAPGTYGTREHPLSFKVGYYTSVAGLGRSPDRQCRHAALRGLSRR